MYPQITQISADFKESVKSEKSVDKNVLNLPFCRKHALDPRIETRGLVQGAAEGLEHGFEHVMDIAAVKEADVEVHACMVHHGLEKVLRKSGVEVLEFVLFRELHLVRQIRSAG